MTTNRRTVRNQVVAWLQANVPGAQTVYSSSPALLNAITPVIYLKSAGSGDAQQSESYSQETLLIEIHTLVLFADPKATPPYTNENSDDDLDNLDWQVRTALEAHWDGDGVWQQIQPQGNSRVMPNAEIEGRTYQHEVRTVAVIP